MTLLHQAIQQLQNKHQNSDELLATTKQWFQTQDTIDAQRRCLQALYFKEMHVREGRVEAAHQRTFEWLLDENLGHRVDTPSTKQSDTAILEQRRSAQANFCAWLRSLDRKSDFFWISGKPGAGKSTLMKFLVHHPLLLKNLEQWAGSHTLVKAHFYFWNHGSKWKGPPRAYCDHSCIRS